MMIVAAIVCELQTLKIEVNTTFFDLITDTTEDANTHAYTNTKANAYSGYEARGIASQRRAINSFDCATKRKGFPLSRMATNN